MLTTNFNRNCLTFPRHLVGIMKKLIIFYTNSNKYSDFINDPISGENMKSSSINRRELKGRMKVVCQ